MTKSSRLRHLIAGSEPVVAPGAYDGLTARLIELAGFPAVYMTGAGTSAAKGLPDYGLLTMTEMVDNAATIARAVSIPVVSDADTGYGNELNVTRAVRDFEARGVAGIHIEDQVFPKRCGHLAGKEVIARDAYVSKIRAAAAARQNPDFVIIARTDARSVLGFEEAVGRANAAVEAGADMAFVEAVETAEELAAVPRQVRAPCLLNVVGGGRTPAIDDREAHRLGYRLVIHPGLALLAATTAVEDALAGLTRAGAPVGVREIPPADFYRRLDAPYWDKVRDGARAE